MRRPSCINGWGDDDYAYSKQGGYHPRQSQTSSVITSFTHITANDGRASVDVAEQQGAIYFAGACHPVADAMHGRRFWQRTGSLVRENIGRNVGVESAVGLGPVRHYGA